MDTKIFHKLRTEVVYDKDAGVYVSSCPAVGVISQGETVTEAELAIESAISLWLEECHKRQSLAAVLAARGFERRGFVDVDKTLQVITVRVGDSAERWTHSTPK